MVPWAQVFSDARLGREIHNQVLAYAHAAGNFGGAFRWMAFIDVDEFLIPKRAASIPEALAHLGHAATSRCPGTCSAAPGHQTPPEGGVLRNYLQRAADPMSDVRGVRAFKCVVDPCHLTALRVHSMETDGSERTCNDRGEAADAARAREARASIRPIICSSTTTTPAPRTSWRRRSAAAEPWSPSARNTNARCGGPWRISRRRRLRTAPRSIIWRGSGNGPGVPCRPS